MRPKSRGSRKVVVGLSDVERARSLYRQGLSQRAIAQKLRRSHWWVRTAIFSVDKGRAAWELDRSKPLAEAILDRLQAGKVEDDDPETLDAVRELVELADRVDPDAELRVVSALTGVTHSLADGFTPATNPLIGIRLQLARRLLEEGSE